MTDPYVLSSCQIRESAVQSNSIHHRHPDNHVDENQVYRAHPVDEIEPDNLPPNVYRSAALRFLRLFNPALQHIGAAIQRTPTNEPWATEIRTAYWQICYAIGVPMCEGQSMTERAKAIGVERATISKGARSFCAANQLPPSPYMKSEDAAGAYQKERIGRVIRGCNKQKFRAA